MDKHMRCRVLLYSLGMTVLAFGLTLNTKTGLGVSPMISVAYCVSEVFHQNFGDMTFLLYLLCMAAQMAMRSRREWVAVLLQLPVSLIFSRFLNLFAAVIPYDSTKHSLEGNLVLLAAAIFLSGLGGAVTMNMRLIPNPGDGIVQTTAEKFRKPQGLVKNGFDFSFVCITLAVGLSCTGRVVGIGIGTVAAMIGAGRTIALVNHFCLEKMLAAAGISPVAEGKA